MMPLANHRGSNQKQQKCCYFGKMPTGGYSGLAAISLSFPLASDHGCRCPRVAVDQVSRSDGSSQIGGFWKVSSLVSGCKERGVTARSRSTPSGVFFALSKYCQCVSGVNSLNGSPRDVVGANDIDDSRATLIHLHSWEPEQHPGDGDNQQGYWDQGNSLQKINGNRRIPNREQQHQGQNQCNSFCKTGAKNLHVINLAATAVIA
jgi:hypothetical protein